jgi:hypothetical protein
MPRRDTGERALTIAAGDAARECADLTAARPVLVPLNHPHARLCRDCNRDNNELLAKRSIAAQEALSGPHEPEHEKYVKPARGIKKGDARVVAGGQGLVLPGEVRECRAGRRALPSSAR